MPITLDTPLSIPAHAGKPAQVYAEVTITHFAVDLANGSMTIRPQYGNTVNGSWVPGDVGAPQILIENRGPIVAPDGSGIPANPAYSILLGTTLVPPGAEGTPVYGIVKLSLYQYLIANVPDYAGEIT